MSSTETQRAADHAVAHESARGHVTGSATFIDDLPLPAGTLHIASGSVAAARGRIRSIDLTAVRAAPGVVDVVVAADVPGSNDIGAIFPGDVLLAAQQLEYAQQPIFVVAARSQRQAQQAARLAVIEVAAEDPQLTAEQALQQNDFVLPTRTWNRGAAATQAPAHEIAGALSIGGQEHFYLEGQVALAIPEEAGQIRVYSSTQHPDQVQRLVASVLAVPMHQVRVICRRLGGGFGGKESQAAPLACLAALCAARTGSAVSYRMPRHDDMLQTGKRHAFSVRYRLGSDADGFLQHAELSLAAQCGYSPDLSEGVVDRAMFHALNAYYAPRTSIVGYRCRTNTVSATAFRGFGGPQGMLAIESAMDELAFARQEDPLSLRLRNLYAPGREQTPYGQTVEQHVLADLIEQLQRSSRYDERQAQVRRFNVRSPVFKKGLALTPVMFGISFTATHLNQAGALVNVYTDGSIEVNHAGTEMGQGLYTKMQQVAAQSFGVPLAQVLVAATQTDKVPNGSPTAASASADMNGMAVLAACQTLQQRLLEFARSTLGWPATAAIFSDGQVRCGARSMPVNELFLAAYRGRVSLSATGFYRTPDVHFDKEAGRGQPFYYFAHGAAASEVVIDTRTGEYRTLRVDILHDAGEPLNRAVDIGQIEGGYVQGAGWLTTEELLWNDQGNITSNSPANYKIPTAHDVPAQWHVELYRNPNPKPTIHRSKAAGEPPVMLAISLWCALRAACAAAGNAVRLPALNVPATPEAVFWAVQEAQGKPRGQG